MMELDTVTAGIYTGEIRKYLGKHNFQLTDDFGITIDDNFSENEELYLYTDKIELTGSNVEELKSFVEYLENPNVYEEGNFFNCLTVNEVFCKDEDLSRIGIFYVFEGQEEMFVTDIILDQYKNLELQVNINKFLKTFFK